jgi:hypothetical protein
MTTYLIAFGFIVIGVIIYGFVMKDVSNPDTLLTEDELIAKYDCTPRQAHAMRRGMKMDEREHAKTKAGAIRTANQTVRTLTRISKKLLK